jgi:hypothetical protein
LAGSCAIVSRETRIQSATKLRSSDVFVNCPFDSNYKPIFDAIVFAIFDLGFVARSAREDDDSGEVRLYKIERIIEECKFGIHDLSAVELDPVNGLPRFNMPLELGLFLGCKHFGNHSQRRKVTLILDEQQYRYQKFISDIAGQDIHPHNGEPEEAIRQIRKWLAAASKRRLLPGGTDIIKRYRRFQSALPTVCEEAKLEIAELTFNDLAGLIVNWLRTNR